MDVLVTGATGFIGRALVLRLQRDGHAISAVARDTVRAADLLGPDVVLVGGSAGSGGLRDAVSRAGAVVHLAGEPVLAGRWTARRRAAIRSSRVDGTRALVEAIRAADSRPAVLVSASAVGYYGQHGRETVDETSPPGHDYLAGVCREWEDAAQPAADLGVRLVLPRIGIVLGPGGGALEKLVPLFRLGLGGPVGTGLQQMPWIHLEDLVEAMALSITDSAWSGPVNFTGPRSVSNEEFTRALAVRLGVRAPWRVPATAVRLLLGEAGDLVLHGQAVDPRRLREIGFAPRHATLEAALEDLLSPATGPAFTPAAELPAELQAGPRPRTTLRASTRVAAPPAAVFPFLARVRNLGPLTPRGARLHFHDPVPDPLSVCAEASMSFRPGCVQRKWRARIEALDPPRRLVDRQVQGPMACWWHEHALVEDGGGTRVEDVIHHALPFGALGALAGRWCARPRLDAAFRFRRLALHMRFGRG